MKYLLIFILSIILYSCLDNENVQVRYIGKVKGKKTYEYTIDSCQYIRTNYKDFVHKGNCNNPIHQKEQR